MNKLTILLIALLSLASSCQKDDMPSDGHKNIFRCKVNGVEWTPHCISDFFGCSAVDCQYYKESGTLGITVVKKYQTNSIDQFFRIYKYGAILGENDIQQTSGNEYHDRQKQYPCGYYDLDESFPHSLVLLEIDTINYIIRGEFEFVVYDKTSSCSDTVQISDGYFDIEYRF